MQNTSLSDICLMHKRKVKSTNDLLDAVHRLLYLLSKWEHDAKTDKEIYEITNWIGHIGRL